MHRILFMEIESKNQNVNYLDDFHWYRNCHMLTTGQRYAPPKVIKWCKNVPNSAISLQLMVTKLSRNG